MPIMITRTILEDWVQLIKKKHNHLILFCKKSIRGVLKFYFLQENTQISFLDPTWIFKVLSSWVNWFIGVIPPIPIVIPVHTGRGRYPLWDGRSHGRGGRRCRGQCTRGNPSSGENGVNVWARQEMVTSVVSLQTIWQFHWEKGEKKPTKIVFVNCDGLFLVQSDLQTFHSGEIASVEIKKQGPQQLRHSIIWYGSVSPTTQADSIREDPSCERAWRGDRGVPGPVEHSHPNLRRKTVIPHLKVACVRGRKFGPLCFGWWGMTMWNSLSRSKDENYQLFNLLSFVLVFCLVENVCTFKLVIALVLTSWSIPQLNLHWIGWKKSRPL